MVMKMNHDNQSSRKDEKFRKKKYPYFIGLTRHIRLECNTGLERRKKEGKSKENVGVNCIIKFYLTAVDTLY